jgi:hypothetical protein
MRKRGGRRRRCGDERSTVTPKRTGEGGPTRLLRIASSTGFANGQQIKMPRNAVYATSDGGAVLGENGEIAE